MTSPSESRPGLAFEAPLRAPAGSDGGGVDAGPPAGAVSLADLVNESGPLPVDAALECLERLADRLSRCPDAATRPLAPADVFLDDDGAVWLREPVRADPTVAPVASVPEAMAPLGRLAAFLVTGDACRLSAEPVPASAAGLPGPVGRIAGRLFSKNGAGYRSYADLARDAAALRDGADATPHVAPAEPAASEPSRSTPEFVSDAPAAEMTDVVEPSGLETAVEDPTVADPQPAGSGVGWMIGVAVAAAAAAAAWFALQGG